MDTTQPTVLALGLVVATSGAVDTFPSQTLFEALVRHSQGDWGELDDEDKETNQRALDGGMRVMSSYTYDGERLWIITEWDRSVTTLLLPKEY